MSFRHYLINLWFVMCSIIWPLELTVSGNNYKIYYFFVILIIIIWLPTQKLIDVKLIKFLIYLTAIGLALTSISFINEICYDNYEKFFKTFPVFVILFIIGYSIGLQSSVTSWLGLYKCALWIVLIITLGLLGEFFFPEFFPMKAPYREQFKYSGFFSEPSHLSYSVFPSILLLIASGKAGMRAIGIMALIAFMIFSRTTTLILLTVLAGFFYLIWELSIKKIFIAFIVILIILISISAFNLDYLLTPTTDRLRGLYDGAQLSTNISSLVYLQGLQDAFNNFTRSSGFGIGFNMMGCNPLPTSSARDIIADMGIPALNSEDGSFLLSKIVSEFGFIGIIFFGYIIFIIFKIKIIYFSEQDKNKRKAYLTIMIILMACMTIFITRTAGYFYGPFLLIPVIFGAISILTIKR